LWINVTDAAAIALAKRFYLFIYLNHGENIRRNQIIKEDGNFVY